MCSSTTVNNMKAKVSTSYAGATTTTNLIKGYGFDTVNVTLMSPNNSNGPLIVSPRWDCSKEFIERWCEVNRSWLDEMLTVRGSVLLRGFDLSTPADMEQVIKSYQPTLSNKYRGTSPRRLQDGTDFIFSAAEVPTNYPIAQHIEMSFLDAPPAQLYFGCVKPSRTAGGETALCDYRTVAQKLPYDLKQKLLDKGIRYTRTHKKVGSYFTYDVSDMLGWPQLFGTNDKKEVERICAEEGIPVAWDENDSFVSMTQSHAFQLHPTTGELVWFNHTQVFHWTTFPAELFFAFQRTWDLRFLFHCILITIFSVIKYAILGHTMSLHTTFGDGTPITVEEMTTIRNVIHENMIFNRWNQGDIMMIDNFAMSHGRQPTYDTTRKIVVAWANPITKQNLVTSLEPVQKHKVVCVVQKQESMNPQETSPHLTPTNDELRSLQEKLLREQFVARIEQQPVAKGLHKKNASEPLGTFQVSDSEFWQEDD